MLSHLWQNFGHMTLSDPAGFEALSAPDYASGAVQRLKGDGCRGTLIRTRRVRVVGHPRSGLKW